MLAYFLISKNNLKSINLFIVLSALIFISFELILYITDSSIFNYLSNIIQAEVFDTYLMNQSRHRFALNNHLELFFPLLFYALISNQHSKIRNIILFLGLISLIFLTVIANSRSRFLSLAFAIVFVFFLNLKYKYLNIQIFNKINKLIMTIVIGLTLFLLALIQYKPYIIVDRILLSEDYVDYLTINSRIQAAEQSVEYFISSPIMGIGLGNYIDNRRFSLKYQQNVPQFQLNFANLSRMSPHNVFFQYLSETGLIGTLPFIIIICYFIKADINYMIQIKRNNLTENSLIILSFIIASWTLFIHGVFNPFITVFITGWFWFLRGVIERCNA